jgi:hypothetical protein
MRPAGEIRLALQQAAQGLISEGVGYSAGEGRLGFTWLQVVHRAKVGRSQGRRTVVNMASAGDFERVGTVAVPGVCRPMTLFAPASSPTSAMSSQRALHAVLQGWVRS